MFEGKTDIEKVLMALSEQLDAVGASMIEMVVCGGAALNIIGYVQRTTEDVDIISFVDKDADGKTVLIKASPLKPVLVEAAKKVQRDFNLKENWLNAGPASVMDFGLPERLMNRVETRNYGKNLIIHFLTRYDQIHFKLYAAVDRGGKHVDDLLALRPTAEELEKAACWSMAHDISDGYKTVLKSFLEQIGYKDVAEKL
ncbi:hypothetical protein KAW96_02635 [candidate division WOR-3 bacterium]|nr:hypothetical protein [candidate division WOR-3 bacterium]